MAIEKLEERLPIEVYKLSNVMMREAQNVLSAQCAELDDESGGFSCVNGWILHYLYNHREEDIFQRNIEQEFCITRSTASKIIRLMEKKMLLSAESVPEDARLKKVVLGQRAKLYRSLMKITMDSLEEQMLQGFSPEELRQMMNFLKRMQKNLKK